MTSVAEFYFCLIPLMSLAPPFKFYFLWICGMTKLSSRDFSTTKYFRIIYFICSSLYRLQYFAMTVSASRSYCRYQSLSHSPPQQNFRQLFFSFRKVWGYPTSIISWFINFNWSTEAVTGRSTKKLHCTSPFISDVCSKLINLLNWTSPHAFFQQY